MKAGDNLMAKKCAIGIDIGATKILFGLFDERLDLIDERKIKTDAAQGEKALLKKITAEVTQLTQRARKGDLALAGVSAGIPGNVELNGRDIAACPNIPFLARSGLRELLRKLTGQKVTFRNDCHLALFAEHRVGAAAGFKNVIGVFLGSGIGSAVIIDGRLHLGVSGCAGDLGHYLLQPIAALSGSRQGFLDDVGSRTALSSEAARLASKQWAPYLQKETGTDVCKIRSNELAASIKHGDKCIEDLVRSRMRTVGIVLSNFVDFLNPDLVLLGGGLVEAMPQLVRAEVKMGIKDHTTPRAGKDVRVVISKLKRHAVTIGGAILALDDADRKRAKNR